MAVTKSYQASEVEAAEGHSGMQRHSPKYRRRGLLGLSLLGLSSKPCIYSSAGVISLVLLMLGCIAVSVNRSSSWGEGNEHALAVTPPETWMPDGQQQHVGTRDGSSMDELPPFSEICNLFDGTWVQDATYPLYRGEDCPLLEPGWQCLKRKSPNQTFASWRWQPNGCQVPRFDPRAFAARLRNTRIAFIGDSLSRNMASSCLCLLQAGLPPGATFLNPSGSRFHTLKPFTTAHEPSLNITLEFYRSHFLIQADAATIDPVSNPKAAERGLWVTPDPVWAERVRGAHILVFNTNSHWIGSRVDDSKFVFIRNGTTLLNLSVDEKLGMALKTLNQWVREHVDPAKTKLFLQGYPVSHFEGGAWDTGGDCPAEHPLGAEAVAKVHKEVGDSVNERVIPRLMGKGVPWRYLAVTATTWARADAHVRFFLPEEHQPDWHRDCVHWCLPGVPDAWNEMLYLMLLQEDMVAANSKGSANKDVRKGRRKAGYKIAK